MSAISGFSVVLNRIFVTSYIKNRPPFFKKEASCNETTITHKNMLNTKQLWTVLTLKDLETFPVIIGLLVLHSTFSAILIISSLEIFQLTTGNNTNSLSHLDYLIRNQ